MNGWLLLIPVISALIGWTINHLLLKTIFHPRQTKTVLGLAIQGVIPARKDKIAKAMAKLVSSEFLSSKAIGEKITSPENFKKIMPQVEHHIDNFLKVKLPQTMPMISMFIGDKTIAQLKTVFVSELELLFPEIMKDYMEKLQEETDLQKIIEEKIIAIPNAKIETLVINGLNRELRMIKIIGGLTGFIIGAIQLVITLFITRQA
jgi:uncharacterized membrane protein YheB (UPF0754 family)